MRRPASCRECGEKIPLEDPAWWRFCSNECAAVRPRKPVVIVASVTTERIPTPAEVERDHTDRRAGNACKVCGDPIPRTTHLGRPRVFCGPKCRVRGKRS